MRARFEPGAAVDAEAEGDVAVLGTIEDDLVGSVEHGRVAIGCGGSSGRPSASTHGAPGELGVVHRDAGHGDR